MPEEAVFSFFKTIFENKIKKHYFYTDSQESVKNDTKHLKLQ